MSGSSRNEKRRKQEAAQQRLRAAGIQTPQKAPAASRTPLIVGGVIVAVIVLVGAFVLMNRTSGSTEPTYSVTASGAVVTAGNGPVVIEVFEDYLCPLCDRFEQNYGNDITTALNEGKLTVKFHTVSILDNRTKPEGYSTRAADAALCAVPAGIYPKYHKKLFDSQPAEGGAGLTDDQLIAFGTELGATGDFAACVKGTTHDAGIKTETEASIANPAYQTNGQFGTPSVAVKGAKINIGDPNWLKNALAG